MEQHTPAEAPGSIRVTVPFVSGEAQQQQRLHGDLVYDAEDPYTVNLVIGVEGGPRVVWSFARDLLSDGLYDPCGDGDVLVWPCLSTSGEAVVVIELRSPSGTAMLQTPSRAVQQFVVEVFEAVPYGAEAERLDLDSVVSRLLAS